MNLHKQSFKSKEPVQYIFFKPFPYKAKFNDFQDSSIKTMASIETVLNMNFFGQIQFYLSSLQVKKSTKIISKLRHFGIKQKYIINALNYFCLQLHYINFLAHSSKSYSKIRLTLNLSFPHFFANKVSQCLLTVLVPDICKPIFQPYL